MEQVFESSPLAASTSSSSSFSSSHPASFDSISSDVVGESQHHVSTIPETSLSVDTVEQDDSATHTPPPSYHEARDMLALPPASSLTSLFSNSDGNSVSSLSPNLLSNDGATETNTNTFVSLLLSHVLQSVNLHLSEQTEQRSSSSSSSASPFDEAPSPFSGLLPPLSTGLRSSSLSAPTLVTSPPPPTTTDEPEQHSLADSLARLRSSSSSSTSSSLPHAMSSSSSCCSSTSTRPVLAVDPTSSAIQPSRRIYDTTAGAIPAAAVPADVTPQTHHRVLLTVLLAMPPSAPTEATLPVSPGRIEPEETESSSSSSASRFVRSASRILRPFSSSSSSSSSASASSPSPSPSSSSSSSTPLVSSLSPPLSSWPPPPPLTSLVPSPSPPALPPHPRSASTSRRSSSRIPRRSRWRRSAAVASPTLEDSRPRIAVVHVTILIPAGQVAALLLNGGSTLEQVLNESFNNLSSSGPPPAAPSAVDQLVEEVFHSKENKEIVLAEEGAPSVCEINHNEEYCTCPICLDNFDEGAVITRMPCGHAFDKECLSHWLVERNTCPSCRYELETENEVMNTKIRERMAGRRTSHPLQRQQQEEQLSKTSPTVATTTSSTPPSSLPSSSSSAIAASTSAISPPMEEVEV
eukprot:TRINITY_DN300_c2_g4_i1.p1 TRINITY_DN300_c2_g4~~TRINITY_DN300_c2_g4_i1.p1  ORF type:complete len:745 (-),score=149.73 TRINITY_DN300_c2_g4_i1:103-2010(-)